MVFGAIYDKYILMMDQQGELFFFVNEKVYFRLKNLFEYNEAITGMTVFGDLVLVATNKGFLKSFNIKDEIKRLKLEIP